MEAPVVIPEGGPSGAHRGHAIELPMSEVCNEAPAPLEGGDLRPWQDVSRNDASPFVHRFQTSGGKYVYDVNTRRIIRVLPVVWDILEDHGCLSQEQIVDRYASVHGSDQVSAAWEEIERTRKDQGIFLSFRPSKVVPPGEDSVRKQLEDGRQQLILNVTEDCNFRCSYCVYGGAYPRFRRHSSRTMDWEVARGAIDEFLSHSRLSKNRTISFYGGEPLLNLPLIRQCVSHVKGNRQDGEVRFAATTNGSLLGGEAGEFLAAERFLIVVSMDGPQEIHDRHRRTAAGEPSWARVHENVRTFLTSFPEYRTNGSIRFNAVSTRNTDLRRVQEFWSDSDLFTDSMGLEVSDQKEVAGSSGDLSPDDPLVASSRALHEDFLCGLKSGRMAEEHDRRCRWVQTSVFQRPLAMFHRRGYLSPHLPETMVFLTGCIPGVRRTFVSTSGEYFACERVVPCPEQAIGNVRGGVSPERVMALLEKWARSNGNQCRHCWCLSHCNMGCLATGDDRGRITETAKGEACARYRRHMHHLLQEYVSVLEANPKALDYTAKFQFL